MQSQNTDSIKYFNHDTLGLVKKMYDELCGRCLSYQNDYIFFRNSHHAWAVTIRSLCSRLWITTDEMALESRIIILLTGLQILTDTLIQQLKKDNESDFLLLIDTYVNKYNMQPIIKEVVPCFNEFNKNIKGEVAFYKYYGAFDSYCHYHTINSFTSACYTFIYDSNENHIIIHEIQNFILINLSLEKNRQGCSLDKSSETGDNNKNILNSTFYQL